MIGLFAASLAGHDKDKIYIIINEEGEYVYLVDGVLRRTDNPKRKNKKHIQIIKHDISDIGVKLKNGRKVSNEEIKRAIRIYIGRKMDVKS